MGETIETPKWEWVASSERWQDGDKTSRLEVPGGWLYKVWAYTDEDNSDKVTIAMCFVPDPTRTGKS